MSSKVDRLVGLLHLKFLPQSTLDRQCLAAIGSIFADKKEPSRGISGLRVISFILVRESAVASLKL